jgi:hypothetical protein
MLWFYYKVLSDLERNIQKVPRVKLLFFLFLGGGGGAGGPGGGGGGAAPPAACSRALPRAPGILVITDVVGCEPQARLDGVRAVGSVPLSCLVPGRFSVRVSAGTAVCCSFPQFLLKYWHWATTASPQFMVGRLLCYSATRLLCRSMLRGSATRGTTLTRALHLSLSWVRPIQSNSPHSLSPRFISVSTHLCLGLHSGHFPSRFPIAICVPVLPIRATCSFCW